MTFAVCNLLVLLWSIFYPWIYVITCWPIKRYHLFEGRCNQLLPLNWFLFVFWLKYAANTDHYINCFFMLSMFWMKLSCPLTMRCMMMLIWYTLTPPNVSPPPVPLPPPWLLTPDIFEFSEWYDCACGGGIQFLMDACCFLTIWVWLYCLPTVNVNRLYRRIYWAFDDLFVLLYWVCDRVLCDMSTSKLDDEWLIEIWWRYILYRGTLSPLIVAGEDTLWFVLLELSSIVVFESRTVSTFATLPRLSLVICSVIYVLFEYDNRWRVMRLGKDWFFLWLLWIEFHLSLVFWWFFWFLFSTVHCSGSVRKEFVT